MFVLLVLLGLVLSLPSQEIGWEERLRNDLFCVEWDVRPCSIHVVTTAQVSSGRSHNYYIVHYGYGMR